MTLPLRVALAIVAAASCSPPRTAPAPIPALPFAADSLRTLQVARGVTRWFIHAPSGPWAIHALVVDRDACWSARAVKGFTGAGGREKTSTLLTRLNDTVQVIGGVNADFFLFTPPGVPTNLHVSRGRMLTPPNNHPVLAFDSSGAPHISRFALTRLYAADSTEVRGSLAPLHPLEAVGGRPILLGADTIRADVDTVGGPGFATARHPRTAVGIARDGKRLILVVVDGRQKPYSDGMSLRELAALMRALGARDAINLDGGGSATMVADSAGTLRVVNRPSDATGERAVGNALAIVRCEGGGKRVAGGGR